MGDIRPGVAVEGIPADPAGDTRNIRAVGGNPVGEGRSTPAEGRLGCLVAVGSLVYHSNIIFLYLYI